MGAVAGGSLTEVIRRILPSAGEKVDAATQLRKELWDEVGNLRDKIEEGEKRIEGLEASITEWKERYFELLRKHNQLDLEYQMTKRNYLEIKAELERVKDNIRDATYNPGHEI